ncbi:precorrin-3B synthase [Streptomyces chumphonensis]|uniref:Precorrin-3B synthase n=2 Tax=Streptomyces chumphonensis TaxID=1214925 RepID=A0A927EXV9_9ACTN|nr:precorrin-3B synthase [Streptomyces chumphonensis]
MLPGMPTPPAPPPFPDGPPPPEGGDACPGSLRPHTADDGLLVRVRIPGGVLTTRQAQVAADAADRLGDGTLHLTSRGNVQLRGLRSDGVRELAGLLTAAGLLPSARHERVRNVVASPLSARDGRGHRDVRPWLRELDALLCASNSAPELSGRFLFALDDGRGDVLALGPDVTLLASPAGDAVLYVADTAAARVPAAEAPRAALLAAETFLTAARECAARTWRVTELPGGPGALARALPQRLRDAGLAAAPPPAPRTAPPTAPPAAPPTPGVLPGAGPDGPVTLSVHAPFGALGTARWRALVDAARLGDADELTLTPWRGVLVPGLPRARAEEAAARLAAAGLVTDPASPWPGVGACVGRPGCAKALADVRADAAAALPDPAPATPAASGTGGVPVYWSGCARRCGHPRGEHVDVLATGDGYRVTAPDGHTVHLPAPAAGGAPPPGRTAAALAAARVGTRTTGGSATGTATR